MKKWRTHQRVRSGALNDRALEQPAPTDEQVADEERAGRLSERGHASGVPAKRRDVSLDPFEHGDAVVQAVIPAQAGGILCEQRGGGEEPFAR